MVLVLNNIRLDNRVLRHPPRNEKLVLDTGPRTPIHIQGQHIRNLACIEKKKKNASLPNFFTSSVRTLIYLKTLC